jgi:hypothetical protein
LAPKEKKLERFFGFLPGLTSWSILIGLAMLSFLKPIAAAGVMIAIYFYWFLRLLYMTLFLILSYFRLSVEEGVDWMDRIKEMDRIFTNPEGFPATKWGGPAAPFGGKEKISLWLHQQKLVTLKKSGSLPPKSSDIHHVVVIAVAKETEQVVEPGIASLAEQPFPSKRILVLIALEERATEEIKQGVRNIEAKYRNSFLDFLVSVHPADVPGEARVKGANVTHAAKEAARYFEEKNIPFENIVVSCFDADTVVSSQYFACLTYHFMTYPNRNQASFQPIPVYHNNIWEAPAFSRILDLGSSFFQFI